jgi:hypothetical protein
MTPIMIRRALLRSWLGTLFIHALLLPPWLLLLASKPWQQWTVSDLALAMFLFLSAGIIVFWTLRLWGAGSLAARDLLLRYGVPLLRTGQLCTVLLLAFLAAKLMVDGWLRPQALWEPWTWGYWALIVVAAAQGIQHYLYKFTSASATGKDGLLEQLERGQVINWHSPMGGSIGVELRRLVSRSRTTAASK